MTQKLMPTLCQVAKCGGNQSIPCNSSLPGLRHGMCMRLSWKHNAPPRPGPSRPATAATARATAPPLVAVLETINTRQRKVDSVGNERTARRELALKNFKSIIEETRGTGGAAVEYR